LSYTHMDTFTLQPDTPVFAFDDAWIARRSRVVRRWLTAEVAEEPALVPDRSWEPPTLVLFGSVLPDPQGGYRMYYTGWVPHHGMTVMLARSDDGIHWHKPNLGAIASPDGADTNIVL